MPEEILTENEAERQEKVNTIKEKILDDLFGNQKPDLLMQKDNVEKSQERLILLVNEFWTQYAEECAVSSDINQVVEDLNNINHALQRLDLLKTSQKFMSHILETEPKKYEELVGLLRNILLWQNVQFLKSYKIPLLKAERQEIDITTKLTLIQMTIDPNGFQYSCDMDLLLHVCSFWGASSHKYQKYLLVKGKKELFDNVKEQIILGIRTAQDIIIKSELFLRALKYNQSKINEIIENSYSSFFVKLMRLPLNTFVFIQNTFLQEIHDWQKIIEITTQANGNQVLAFKQNDFRGKLERFLKNLDEELLSQLYREITDQLPRTGCPALYSRTLLEVFNAALGEDA